MIKSKLRLISFVMAMMMIFSSSPLIPTVAQEELSSTDVACPFGSDISFTVDGKTVTSNSYRIPSMVTLADGTMVAAADIRWNTTYDGGCLDTLVARSTDGGVTWSYVAANYLGDNGNSYNGSSSTAFIDPCLTVAADGQTLYMLCDLYPYGVALNGSGNTQPATSVGFTDEGYLRLSGDNHSTYSYYLKEGNIYQSSGSVVSGYTVDEYFNLYCDGTLTSNLFYANSPYQVVRTGFLYLTSSTDGGASWSAPTLLNLKTSAENVCLVGPGRGLTTSDGTMVFPVYSYGGTSDSQRTGFIYSKDGVTWERAQSNVSWSSEAAVVEIGEGTLRFFYRNGNSTLCYVDYDMSAGTWGSYVNTGVATNSNTQLSAITYSKTYDGKQVILVSCPTGPNAAGSNNNNGGYRLNGRIFTGIVKDDGTMTWNAAISVNDTTATAADTTTPYTEDEGFFGYSCLTERSDGSIALLYENRENAWGAGDRCYYSMNMRVYSASELGIDFDSADTDIDTDTDVDADGPSSVVSSNGVSVTSPRVKFTGVTVTKLTAPTAVFIKNAVAYEVIPQTEDGNYTGMARVTIDIPEGWDTSKVFGYVREADGTLTILPGTTSATGMFSFTTPHFSEIGLFEATGIADVTEGTVVLEIGETSSEIVVSDTSTVGTEGEFTTDDGAVNYTVHHTSEAGGYTTTKVETLTAGDTVVISDGNGNYLVRNGSRITTTTNVAEATVWTVGTTTSGWTTYYTLSNGGYYLRPRSGRNSYSLNVNILSDYNQWSYNSDTGFSYSSRYLCYDSDWSVAQRATSYGAAYSLTQTEAVSKTTVTFDGLNVTTGTPVVIGDTTYTVIVNAKSSEESKFLLTGNSTTLDALADLGFSGDSYTVTYTETSDDGNVITLNGAQVFAGSATGEATVTATVSGANGNTVGTVTYTITVSDVEVTDTKNIYVPVGGTATVEGLTGEIYTSMLDAAVATVEPSSGTLSSDDIVITGVSEGMTSVVVGTVQFNIYVNPANAQNTDAAKYIYIYVDEIDHCTVYYSINGGELYQVEGVGVLIDQTYYDGFNIMFFASPNDGYALTEMGVTNSNKDYYSLSNGTKADGSDSDAWPFVSADQSTIPSSSSDSAWVSGHGFRWCLLEGNMSIADMRDLFTRALVLGCDGATTITKNAAEGISTHVSFKAEQLPSLEKTIVSYERDGVTYAYTAGTTLEFGDIVTYKFTITTYSSNVVYTDIKLTDNRIGYSNTSISDGALNTAGQSLSYTAEYEISSADVDKYTNGTFWNEATLEYTYKSEYSAGTKDAFASAAISCKINGIVYYVWMEGLPEEITNDTTNYPLPGSETVTYGETITVKDYTGNPTYDVVNSDGLVVGTWEFVGWKYNGTDYAAGSTLTMPQNDSVEFVGIWEYTPSPVYTVTYEWMNAPAGTTLPTDSNRYYERQEYFVDSMYQEGTTIDDGTAIWTFSGWTLEGTVVSGTQTMGNANVTLVGEWTSEQKFTSLTIKKDGYSEYESIDPNQTFLFQVTGDVVDLTVTVHGAGSVTITGLKVGETYTVTELTEWSWRYEVDVWSFTTGGETDASGTANGAEIILGATGNEITFTNRRSEQKWLDGDSYRVNIFTETAN